MAKRVVVLGSTGSIGKNTLSVIEEHPEEFQVIALGAGRNTKLLYEQVKRFRPRVCCVLFEEDVRHVRRHIEAMGCEVLVGKAGYKVLSRLHDADVVVSAMVGAAGLIPTIAALEAGKTVCLANKESLVIGGHLVARLLREKGGTIVPVDSEHSAIFQCLNGEDRSQVKRIHLTASGGPFWGLSMEELETVTVEDALEHPNWSMGAKITVDSATMMNKGLEVIEARWLFDCPVDCISVLVHRQSIVHSMVEFRDGAFIAQMGVPDMRIAIAYALSWPKRLSLSVEPLDLVSNSPLTFEAPDLERFPMLGLGFEAARKGGVYPVALNAANEMAVQAFLEKRIGFLSIYRVVQGVLERTDGACCHTLDDILYQDSLARLRAEDMIKRLEA